MKVVLIRPGGGRIPWTMPPSLGLGYIAAAVKKAGHECVIHDAMLHYERPDQTYRNMPDGDIIGIQVFYTTIEWTKRLVEYIPQSPSRKIIVGGPHITVMSG